MKTHTIKTPTAELLIVELEKGARKTASFIVDVNGDPILDNYTLLGKPDEIREEYARELVESDEISDVEDYRYQITFIDYKDEENSFPTAKESILSLLESEIYWDVNPIPTPEIQGGFDELGNFHGEYDDNWVSAFKEAQEKTFDKNRSLIFKKR